MHMYILLYLYVYLTWSSGPCSHGSQTIWYPMCDNARFARDVAKQFNLFPMFLYDWVQVVLLWHLSVNFRIYIPILIGCIHPMSIFIYSNLIDSGVSEQIHRILSPVMYFQSLMWSSILFGNVHAFATVTVNSESFLSVKLNTVVPH